MMYKLNSEQRLNMLAIEMLEKQGNDKPSQQQIDRMESYLQQMHEIKNIQFFPMQQRGVI